MLTTKMVMIVPISAIINASRIDFFNLLLCVILVMAVYPFYAEPVAPGSFFVRFD
jgi:hypothetical protein